MSSSFKGVVTIGAIWAGGIIGFFVLLFVNVIPDAKARENYIETRCQVVNGSWIDRVYDCVWKKKVQDDNVRSLLSKPENADEILQNQDTSDQEKQNYLDRGTTCYWAYMPYVRVQYEANEVQLEGFAQQVSSKSNSEFISFSGASTWMAQYELGSIHPCYYDKEKSGKVVMELAYNSRFIASAVFVAIFGLLFLALPLFGGLALVVYKFCRSGYAQIN